MHSTTPSSIGIATWLCHGKVGAGTVVKSKGTRSNLAPEDEDHLILLFRKIRRPGPDEGGAAV